MDKEKRQKRFQQKERHVNKQVNIAKAHVPNFEKTKFAKNPGRFQSVTWCTCGNSNCVMCGNPRKFFSELTIQEKKQQDFAESFNEEL